MNQVICDSIQQMKTIAFDYSDEEGNVHHRIVEPYAHGLTTRGNEALRGYQVGGNSETTVPGWKLFVVDRMAALKVTEDTFDGTAPGYAHGDSALNPIYCRVP